LPSDQIPVWPFGTPQQRRSCRAVSLSSAARPLAPAADWDARTLAQPVCASLDLYLSSPGLVAPRPLISPLAAAIDAAHGQAHDIVLPELPAATCRVGGAGQAGDTTATASPFTRLVTWIGIQSAA
jgi:hypothetical protein